MKLDINSKVLLDAVKVVGACVKQKNTMPILDNVLFEVAGKSLKITADNLEIRTQIEIDIVSKEKFSICVPYKKLVDILSVLANCPMSIKFEGSIAVIETKFGVYSIPCEDGNLFVQPKEFEDFKSIKVSSGELIDAFRNGSLFIPPTDFDNLSNLFLNISDDGIKVYTSDKNVMYEYSLTSIGELHKLLIPRSVVKYLSESLMDEQEIELNYTDTHLILKVENHSISAILSEGKTPQFEKLFSSFKFDKTLTIDRELLQGTVKRLSSINDHAYQGLSFDITSENVTVYFNNIDTNTSAKEVLPCKFDGENLNIGFKAEYILKIISVLETEDEISFKMIGEDKPCLISCENTRILLAPMKINNEPFKSK